MKGDRTEPVSRKKKKREPIDFWVALRTAALVAGAGFLAAAPYYYYLLIEFPSRLKPGVVRSEMVLMALSVVVAALVGALFSQRYNLAGLGGRSQLRQAARLILIGGPIIGLFSYFVFGQRIAALIPGYYPDALGWAFVMTLKGAVFEEVVARYGMMTICAGVAPKRWIANAMQATFFSAIPIFKGLSFFGLTATWDTFFMLSLLFSFVIHFLFGAVYGRFGLLASVALHFVIELKFVLHLIVS